MERKKKKGYRTVKSSKAVYILKVIISNSWLKFHDKLIHNAKFLAKILHAEEYTKSLFS